MGSRGVAMRVSTPASDSTVSTMSAGVSASVQPVAITIGQPRAAITKLDVAMMLDVSGSMKGDKLRDLKDAASDAIDMLVNDRTGDPGRGEGLSARRA